MRLGKLKIGAKLIGGFLTVVVLLLGVFGVGYYGLNSIGKASDKLYSASQGESLWQEWQLHISRANSYYLAYLSSPQESLLTKAQAKINEANEVEKQLSEIVSSDRKSQLETIASNANQLYSIQSEACAAYASGNQEQYNKLLTQWVSVSGTVLADIDNIISESKQATAEQLSAAKDTQNSSILMMVIISIVAALAAIGIALFLSGGISNSIKKVNKGLNKMVAGDLTENVAVNSSDEVGEMAVAYNHMLEERIKVVQHLRSIAGQLGVASEQLAAAANQSGQSTQQVASSSQEMAKGAQEQSTNAQETSKSLNQLSETIAQLSKGAQEQSAGVQKAVESITNVSNAMIQVANNTNLAAKGSELAAKSAVTGTEKFHQTLSGMEKINQSVTDTAKKIEELGARSTEIGKIVSVIDDIAAQTNLLALNAAIEAARAGEQGRGFAVVSDEVRKLAERTATATKEIADLIGAVQDGVNEATKVMALGTTAVTEGYTLAKEAGQVLEQIQKTSSEVNSQIGQISAKSQEVSAATEELVKVIDNVGSVTEQNTAATEQMSANAVQVSKAMETFAGISEENSAATEQVSASAQEMNAQVEEIVASSQTLKDMAASLEKSVAFYKLPESVASK